MLVGAGADLELKRGIEKAAAAVAVAKAVRAAVNAAGVRGRRWQLWKLEVQTRGTGVTTATRKKLNRGARADLIECLVAMVCGELTGGSSD